MIAFFVLSALFSMGMAIWMVFTKGPADLRIGYGAFFALATMVFLGGAAYVASGSPS